MSDLLDHHELGLELLSGGRDVSRRRLSGVHSIEIESPTRWLPPHWVMLTNGMRLRGAADAQRALIAELDEGGIAGLGFAIGTIFKSVPRALLDEARERSFPVFAIPLRVPFRAIITFVNQSLISSEIRTLQRLSSIQRYLIDSLHEVDPGATLMKRLATVADARTIVFAPDGCVTASSGKLPPIEPLWNAVAELPPAAHDLRLDSWYVHATPVGEADGRPGGWLVLASPRSGALNELTKPVAQAAAPLVAAVGWLGQAARVQESVVRQALLEDVLRQRPGEKDGELAARVATWRVDFSSHARVVFVAPLADGNRSVIPTGAIANDLERLCATLSAPHLIARRASSVVALVQHDPDGLLASLEELVERRPEIVVGIGRAFGDIAGASASLRDAQLAAAPLARRERRLLDFEQLDLARLLVAEAPKTRIGPKVEEIISTLEAHAGIYDAVEAYLAHDLSIKAAADALFLHPNSLRYRLSRAEELLEISLKQPAAITALYVALLVRGPRASSNTPPPDFVEPTIAGPRGPGLP
jgi:purine catabolism regulator